MAESKTDISDFLQKSMTWPIMDVRSPAEYSHGHIPGAANLPLFTNEERSIVGTLYLQKGSAEAMLKGLEMAGPKLKEYTMQAFRLAPAGEILLYCWRGGMRSNSMAWLLNTAGMRALTLDGGYKAYRSIIQAHFSQPYNLVIIGGMTGSGKTEILEEIEKSGHQVIHLERLASHKGSVFGHLGMPGQPTTEQFENNLFTVLRALDARKPVFVEDESLAIGRVFIPQSFYSQMSTGLYISLLVPFALRVKRLIETYTMTDKELLIAGIRRIEKRLGTENANLAIGSVIEGNMERAVETVLGYYDKVYKRSMGLAQRKESMEMTIRNDRPEEVAAKILETVNKAVGFRL